MARPRSSATELARLFNRVPQPIYVLDDEGTIVFCNQACLDWIGEGEETLLGLRCEYHSLPDVAPTDSLAAGLCPPPTALAGQEQSAVVAVEGRKRRASFLPLGRSPESPAGLVAIVDAKDLADDAHEPPAAAEPPPTELHEQIRRFRRQMAVRYRADLLLGRSATAGRVRSQVQLAAGCRASVLVVGPPGSGRQHVAATIHYAGDAGQSASLVPLACSLLSAELIHSTLRAIAARTTPDGGTGHGTLLLGDVDELSLDVQAALATLLAKAFPLRLMATARRGLAELTRRGEFRADLAAILSTIVIELPPLAERRADIPLLAQFFLEEANARGAKQLAGFSAEALDRLDAYPWPGNSDELARAVTEAHQRADGPEIMVGDLPQRIMLASDEPGHPRRKEETIVLDEFLARIERELIERALARAKGNKAKAARLLGMTRPRLYRRLVQLGMEEEK